ncbi:uncharacterized protein EV422DRAFT_619530 [Fimicolochytrium jonesii]|uniref:uncharacterized protein n=1 Tax=Fimicolochytrium jonesii TaxID=1396493 RepID=UPI0022FDE27E|nr:uncharacterized protein EV422DRAFT_619530 [Fimicolochytrium jonesii]KAI8821779.1 hypothetical protein EV422DRAFT_619530 [Fimicolochytrium jonesii]
MSRIPAQSIPTLEILSHFPQSKKRFGDAKSKAILDHAPPFCSRKVPPMGTYGVSSALEDAAETCTLNETYTEGEAEPLPRDANAESEDIVTGPAPQVSISGDDADQDASSSPPGSPQTLLNTKMNSMFISFHPDNHTDTFASTSTDAPAVVDPIIASMLSSRLPQDDVAASDEEERLNRMHIMLRWSKQYKRKQVEAANTRAGGGGILDLGELDLLGSSAEHGGHDETGGTLPIPDPPDAFDPLSTSRPPLPPKLPFPLARHIRSRTPSTSSLLSSASSNTSSPHLPRHPNHRHLQHRAILKKSQFGYGNTGSSKGSRVSFDELPVVIDLRDGDFDKLERTSEHAPSFTLDFGSVAEPEVIEEDEGDDVVLALAEPEARLSVVPDGERTIETEEVHPVVSSIADIAKRDEATDESQQPLEKQTVAKHALKKPRRTSRLGGIGMVVAKMFKGGRVSVSGAAAE